MIHVAYFFSFIMNFCACSRGGSGSHYVEASFWRRLWTCRQTEYWM